MSNKTINRDSVYVGKLVKLSLIGNSPRKTTFFY